MSWRAPPILALSILFLATGPAYAQFAAPTPASGPSIAPPTAVPAPSIAPPTPTVTARGAAASLAPAQPRADHPLIINALIGNLKGEPIIVTEVLRPIDAPLRQAAAESANPADFASRAEPLIRKSLSDLASDILVVSAASSQLTDQDQQRIDWYMAVEKTKMLAQYGGVDSAAERALRAVDSSIEKEMRGRRRSVIKQIYFQKNLLGQVVITRPMLMAAYEKDPKRWQQIAQVELYTITLPVSNWLRGPGINGAKGPILTNPTDLQIKDAEATALAEGKAIVAQLKAGEDFARLVEDKNSLDEAAGKGGNQGWVSKGSMLDTKREDYIFSLPPNSIGEPYLSHEPNFKDSTMRVIKVGDKKTARTIPFDEAQATLFAELKERQITELETQEMAKLSGGAAKELELLDRNMPVAVEVAKARYATK